MKVLLSWLRDYAAIPDDPQVVGDALTSLGLAVEETIVLGAPVPGVITARVLETQRHPQAEKVHEVFVDPGTGERLHVWCGAFNMSPGDVIPLATAGTRMPDGRLIEPRPILGIPSEGMLCSALELGLGADHSGIMLLPGDTPLGVPIMEALGIVNDTLFDLDITRNRPDAYGYIGIARDLAAHFGVPFTPPSPQLIADGPVRIATVEIVDGEACTRFTSTVISGIEVKSSAPWMARRLAAAGMRAINNVVDVSNYVMLELNQPSHAYDLATLGGGGFRIRRATEDEPITTLDGVTRTMSPTHLLITDATDRPIGIAGIMGGENTEISNDTTVVALEIAMFEAVGISQSVPRLGLRSEASARFERGVDPWGHETSIARFAELLGETCPNLVVHGGWVDAQSEHQPPRERSILVRVDRVNKLLGTDLSAETMIGLLDPIGFTATSGEGGILTVSPPSWRPDATIEADVAEEVARHYGYDRIGKTVPKSTVHGRLSPIQARRRQLRELLLGLGMTEALPNPFLAAGDLERAGIEGRTLTLANPIVAEEDTLRTSLRPGLLKAVAYNASHRQTGVTLYEIGRVYPPGDEDAALPNEFEQLGVIMAGRDASAAVALWREISTALGFGARVDQSLVPSGMHPGRSATLSLGRQIAGAVGEIHPDVAERFGIDERLAYLELDLSIALAIKDKPAAAAPVSRYPSSEIDLAFVAPDSVAAERIEKAIKQAAGNLAVDIRLFDVYRGPGVADDARSLAYRLVLQASDRTLKDAEVAELRDKCIVAAAKAGAQLR
jgi:phenylalanyl-tRNA synthetase beta chain